MKYLFCFFILISCGSIKPSPKPPAPVPTPVPSPVQDVVIDTIHISVYVADTPKSNILSVKDFGAQPGIDNADAFQRASDYIIQHPEKGSNLYIPPGNYFQSRPWILQSVGSDGRWKFFHIKIIGEASAKSSPDAGLTTITCGYSDGFGIGVQFGRDVEIENIVIVGAYQPPPINIYNNGTVRYTEWSNGTAHDSRFAPYSGIAIDPFCDSSMINAADSYTGMRSQYLPNTGRGGTSGMKITKCRINNFVIGIALTPNGYTQNDEDIDITDDNIYACKVNIAVCQDQAKAIVIDHLKSWGPTYTVLDGLNYGAGTGGGSLTCSDWNIAGCVNQFFNLSTGRFPLSCYDLHGESVFRIGNVGSGMANFFNTQIDFLTGPGLPEADYLIQGIANFYGGMLRYYDNDMGHRLNFATVGYVRYGFMFRDLSICNLPITQGLYGVPTNWWASARFDNVTDFLTGYDIKNKADTLIAVSLYSLNIDRSAWTGTATVYGAQVNDYLLAEPTSTTGTYYDGPGSCTTKVLGRITSVSGNTVTLDHVSVNAYSGLNYGRIYLNRMK